MIASIRGTVAQTGENWAVIEVGGVGLRVSLPAPLAARAQVGKPFALFTHLVVREDALSLYGFETPEQLTFFETLLGVSGIGPKLALSLLSHFSIDVLRDAIARGRPDLISGVPGVGKKTAENVIFHLKDKLGAGLSTVAAWGESDTDIIAGLTSLGYSLVEAQAALQSIPRDAPSDTETRLRLAIQSMGKR